MGSNHGPLTYQISALPLSYAPLSQISDISDFFSKVCYQFGDPLRVAECPHLEPRTHEQQAPLVSDEQSSNCFCNFKRSTTELTARACSIA